MTTIELTADELHVITGALRVAGTQYDRDAKDMRFSVPVNERLVEQFDRQASDARQLLERLENLDD
jgi:hypothetical protein